MAGKPSVCILGGLGFIGRNLVSYLVDGDLASFVRVSDKQLPETTYFTPQQRASFDNKIVEYVQSNLTNDASAQKALQREDGSGFDIVVCLAGETKYGLSMPVYQDKVTRLSEVCAKAAAVTKTGIYVYLSTTQVYEGSSKPATESSPFKPWTEIGKAKVDAEKVTTSTLAEANIPLVILRPATVYGPGDLTGLTPRLITAHVYKHLKEEMKLLWTKDLRVNTVHVEDVCRAIVTVAEKCKDSKGSTVFNLADSGDTTQETINTHVRAIFGINTGYQGTVLSKFAKLNLKSVTRDANEDHIDGWSSLIKEAGVTNTPLSPYLDSEQLADNHVSIDGSGVCKTLGFEYKHPEVTEEALRGVITQFQDLGLWPKF